MLLARFQILLESLPSSLFWLFDAAWQNDHQSEQTSQGRHAFLFAVRCKLQVIALANTENTLADIFDVLTSCVAVHDSPQSLENKEEYDI